MPRTGRKGNSRWHTGPGPSCANCRPGPSTQPPRHNASESPISSLERMFDWASGPRWCAVRLWRESFCYRRPDHEDDEPHGRRENALPGWRRIPTAARTAAKKCMHTALLVALASSRIARTMTRRKLPRIVASGLLLAHLPRIGKRHDPDRPQVWRLKPTEERPRKLADLRDAIERKSGLRVDDFRLTREVLQEPVLRAAAWR